MKQLNLESSRGMAVVSGLVAWTLLAAPGANAAVVDVEPNDSIATAQSLDLAFSQTFDPQVQNGILINTSTVFPHADVSSTGDASGTLDYYSFTVPEIPTGALIIIEIDCGQNVDGMDSGCAGYGSGLDSWIQLYDPSGNLFAINDDAPTSPDAGSESSIRDSQLEVTVPGGGVWTVAVGEYPALSPIDPGEDYILHVSVQGHPALDSEPNDAIGGGQQLDRLLSLHPNAQVQAARAIPHADVISPGGGTSNQDFYSVVAPPGARIIVDIDCGANLSGTDTGCAGYGGSMDSRVTLYSPSNLSFADNDNAGGDPGSESSSSDSFLDVVVPVGGLWTVAVGTPGGDIPPLADYILHVSVVGAQPEEEQPVQRLDGLFHRTFDAQVEIGSPRVNRSTIIPHVEVDSLGDFSGTVDQYAFYVPIAGTRIYADIDCGHNLSGTDSGCAGYGSGMDSFLRLIDPSGTIVVNTDDSDPDAGSESSSLDSYLDYRATEAGVWTVAVLEAPGPDPVSPGEDYILHLPEPSRSAVLIPAAMALALLYRRRARAAAAAIDHQAIRVQTVG